MTAPNYPNSTLAVVAWLNGVAGVQAATQLPRDNTTWGASGFATVQIIAGSPNQYLPQGEPIAQINCCAVNPGSGRPLWNVANNVASAILRSLRDEVNKGRTLTLPSGYAPCRVIQAYATREPTRLYSDDGSYAIISFDAFFRWTLLQKADV